MADETKKRKLFGIDEDNDEDRFENGKERLENKEEDEEDLPSSTPLKFIKGDNGKKTATAEESEASSEDRKRKLFRDTNEAKITFFGFDASELERFVQSRKMDFKVIEEGGNFIKCVCRCNDAFPTQKSFLKLDGTVFEENKKTVGVIMDPESAAALPRTPRINAKVFDSSCYPENNRRKGNGFGWFGLSWLFDSLSHLFN